MKSRHFDIRTGFEPVVDFNLGGWYKCGLISRFDGLLTNRQPEDEDMSTRKLKFKTELNQLMDIIVHSLYSHREVFLRELPN